MRMHGTVIALIWSTLCLYAQKEKDFVPLVHDEMKEKNKLIFVCKYEVSNGQYLQFLTSLLTTAQTEKYNSCLYDSLGWNRAFKPMKNGGDPMLEYYHSHPAFAQYPIVNITKEAAQAFCNWQTETYHAQLSRKFKKVVFRLPTEWEWLCLASALPNHNLPWQGTMPYTNPQGTPALCNIKFHFHGAPSTYGCYDCDGYPFQAPIKEYLPNKLGLYHVIGNVAEMTESGIIKGGSWADYLEECTVEKSQNYSLPDPRVGFRVIMEIIDK